MFYNYKYRIINLDRIVLIEKDGKNGKHIYFESESEATSSSVKYPDTKTRDIEYTKLVTLLEMKGLLLK
jgi:hypothetical protein